MSLTSLPKGSPSPIFKPFQVVCLEHEATCLYAEVVQLVELTHICWVRPLMLVQKTESTPPSLAIEAVAGNQEIPLFDLRQGCDLLLPASLFRDVLDTEVIALLAELNSISELKGDRSLNHSKLNQFIQQVCSAYPEVFQNKLL